MSIRSLSAPQSEVRHRALAAAPLAAVRRFWWQKALNLMQSSMRPIPTLGKTRGIHLIRLILLPHLDDSGEKDSMAVPEIAALENISIDSEGDGQVASRFPRNIVALVLPAWWLER